MKNTVHLCDCMEFMKALPDNAYDLAIVDPPYGISVNMNAGRKKNAAAPKRDNKKWDKSPPEWDFFRELGRLSENQIIWGANNFWNMPPKQGWVFWDKCVATGASFSDGELAWTSFDMALKKAIIPWSGFIGADGERIHPTQKPIALYKWLLQNYAKPGQTIFDSHVGSGSIRIACHDLGYSFEGCEIDADYWQAQEDRFQTHKAQGTLFEPEELTKETYKQVEMI